jgi:diguanylate cyclase (GGDEF)-like protein
LAFTASLQAQQYVFRTFRQAEGLKNLAVNALVTDHAGFLWLATENGVFRFIGSGFERYGPEQGLTEPYVLDLISDPDGTLWAATEENLYRWDGQRFLPAGSDPIPIRSVRHITVEDARHLLVVTKGHLYRLEHDAENRMLSFLPVFSGPMLAAIPDLAHVTSVSVVHDAHGGMRIWAGCGKGLCTWPGWQAGDSAHSRDGGVTEWSKDQGLVEDQWEGVLLDRAGTIWAGGFAHVAVLSPGATHFIDHSIPGPGLAGFFSHAPLIEDSEGRILVPTEEGIARWDGAGWRTIGRANGMERAAHIIGMTFDNAGDLWFASRGDGLCEWTGYANWESWGERQGLPAASIWAVSPSHANRIILGTEHGPAWIDPVHGSAGPLSNLRPWPFDQVQGLVVERDGVLLGVTLPGFIFRLDPATGRTIEMAKLPMSIISAFQDSSGRLFMMTAQGIYLSQSVAAGNRSASPGQEDNAIFRTPHRIPAADALAGKSTAAFTACESPDGTDWFAVGSHLLRFKDGQWSLPSIDGMSRQSGRIFAMYCTRENAVWLATSPGSTWRLTNNGDRLMAWQLVPPSELRALEPLAILIDSRGWVWLGTDQGLLVWNGQNWRHLAQESGLIWNDVNEGMISEASDGSLWIGTSGGVSHLLHPERVFDPIPLTVSMTAFQRGETSYLGLRQVTLPWAGLPLRFRISSPAMRNRSELTYKFQMVGLLKGWVTSDNGVVNFSSLAPGSYTFMAMVCNPGFNACSDPVKVDVKILPPWWRSSWFYGLCGLAFIGILVGGVHLYARQLRARSRELERLVSVRTVELEASHELLREQASQLLTQASQLRIQASHDGLTGILNRVGILAQLEMEMERVQRERRPLVLVIADLDHFKIINDTYGHLVGDEALRGFTTALRSAARLYDHVGRYGGEEFLLILANVSREVMEKRLLSLHASVTNLRVTVGEKKFTLNCSMGAALYDVSPGPGSAEVLLKMADEALYAAKDAGRNRIVFHRAGTMPFRKDGSLPAS